MPREFAEILQNGLSRFVVLTNATSVSYWQNGLHRQKKPGLIVRKGTISPG
jgi:hypothetical protein